MKKNLFLRTDILPEEIPILFDNKNVYLNFSKSKVENYSNINNSNRLLDSYSTIPLFFDIPKSKNDRRKIALLHPIAQLQAFNYILKFEYLIISFCSQSSFSVRSPIKRNIPKINLQQLIETDNKRLAEEFLFENSQTITTDEGLILYHNYFSYNKFKKITHLYSSIKFTRDKYKFKYFKKLDIQNFFPSIYTHALAWSIFGEKSLAKKYKNEKTVFPNQTDKIMQTINFDETNGIVVGPEFSRIIAELLLTRIDTELLLKLSEQNLHQFKDYNIYRYIDDYFIFANSEEHMQLIESNLKKLLENYNLSINNSKSVLQQQPFMIHDNSIVELKRILNEFILEKHLNYIKTLKPNTDNCYKLGRNIGTLNNWNNLLSKVEFLISTQPESKTRIVNYFLKAIRSEIFSTEERHFIIIQALEIVSNLYSLSINYKSTNSLLSIYIKLYREYERLENNSPPANLSLIEEKMFHQLLTILKRNSEKINDMNEIIIFMKILSKRIPATFLCELLSNSTLSYFSICTIAYYILNSELTDIDESYKTVQNKLKNFIDSKINSYCSKGNESPILDAEYFYYLNDFSKYPGFNKVETKKYNDILVMHINKIKNQKSRNSSPALIQAHTEIWINITKRAYFKWDAPLEDFMKKLIKKTIHHQYHASLDY